MGMTGLAKTQLMPRKYAAAQNFFTAVIRTVMLCAQEALMYGPMNDGVVE